MPILLSLSSASSYFRLRFFRSPLSSSLRSETHFAFFRCPEFSDLQFDLLSRMLTKDPVKRASIMDIYQHSWLQTKPKRKKYFGLACPTILWNMGDCELEEDDEGRNTAGSFMGLTGQQNQKWKKTPLTIITEDTGG